MKPEPEDEYVTVREAAERIGYSTRQTDRLIKKGELEVIRHSRSLRKVSVASIDAFNQRNGRRPVDSLKQVKEQLHTQEQVAGDILRQLAVLRQLEAEHYIAIQRRCTELEGQVRVLRSDLQKEQETRRQLEQFVAGLAAGSSREDIAHLLQSLAVRMVSRQHIAPLAKRGYPPGTLRLAPFAERHGVEPSTARRQAEKRPELVTIYERQEAEVNKREWWLLPEQQAPMIAHWQALGIPYTPCSDCPHAVNATV